MQSDKSVFNSADTAERLQQHSAPLEVTCVTLLPFHRVTAVICSRSHGVSDGHSRCSLTTVPQGGSTCAASMLFTMP